MKKNKSYEGNKIEAPKLIHDLLSTWENRHRKQYIAIANTPKIWALFSKHQTSHSK